MDDQELFNSAVANDPSPAPEPTAEQQPSPEPPASETKADATGRLHGEGGKFVPKAKDPEPTQQEAAPAPEPQQRQAEPEHRVPLAEHLSEREKRQAAERRAEDTERRITALQQQLAQLQKPQEQPKTPDIFEDPNGFVGSLEQKFEQRLRQQEANFSFRLAHQQNGKEFEDAYQALLREGEMGNRTVVQSVMASNDPGQALMRWHKQSTLFERTGGDLDKYLQQHTESLLKDQAFLAKAIEAVRAQGNGNPNARPESVINLPKSISKVPAAGPALDGDNDLSDAGLYRHAIGR